MTASIGQLAGRVVVLTDRSVFKVGIVIGISKVAGKLRVRPWSNSPARWSATQVIESGRCQDVDENLRSVPIGEARRRRAVVRRAVEHSLAAGAGKGWV